MSRRTMSTVKAVGTGMVVGMTVLAAGSKLVGGTKMKKSTGKAIKAVGDLVSNIQYMMK